MIALRGATTISKDSHEEIKKASIELFEAIIRKNNIDMDCIVSMLFSCTKDITKAYPGSFIREHFNLKSTAIMHFNEMEVDNELEVYLPLCIRVMILLNGHNKKPQFVYLNEAKKLREDLFVGKSKN